MGRLIPVLLAVAVAAGSAPAACTDAAASRRLHVAIEETCGCTTGRARADFGRCVKQTVRAALDAGRLPRPCRRKVQSCLRRSVCGRADRVVCCDPGGRSGQVRATIRKAAACRGTICRAVTTVCDACAAPAACTVDGAVLTVDDPELRGAVADAALSLAEAIRLATGELEPAVLSDGERRQIRGEPGRGRADLVRLAPDLTVAVRSVAEAVPSILPPLSDARDTLDGNANRIDGGPMQGRPQRGLEETVLLTDEEFGTIAAAPLLVIGAGGVRVRGLVIDDVAGATIVVQGADDGGVDGVVVEGNVIRGPGLGVPGSGPGIAVVAGTNTGGRRVADLRIDGNEITDKAVGIAIVGGWAVGPGARSDGNAVEGIEVRGNRIERTITGVSCFAARAERGGGATGNVVRGVRAIENQIRHNLDSGIVTATSQQATGDRVDSNRLADVRVEGNTISGDPAADRANVGMFHSGGQVFFGGTSRGDHYAGLAIERNVVTEQFAGLIVVAGHLERCGDGCSAAEHVVERVRVHANTWREVASVGVSLFGGIHQEAAGSVRANVLRDVVLEDEMIEAGGTGVFVAGSLATFFPPNGLGARVGFPGAGLPGAAQANEASAITVRESRITATDAVLVVGGNTVEADDAVSASFATAPAILRNTLSFRRNGITLLGGLVVGRGTVRDGGVTDARATANRTPRGTAVAVFTLPQIALGGAETGSVSGNTVSTAPGE